MLHSELSRWERPPRRILHSLVTGIHVPGCCYDVVQAAAGWISDRVWQRTLGNFHCPGENPTSQHHHLFLLQWPTTTPAVCCLCVAQHFFGMLKNSLFSSHSPAKQEERKTKENDSELRRENGSHLRYGWLQKCSCSPSWTNFFPSLRIVLPFPSAAKNPFFFLNFQPLKGAIIGSECSMRISFFQRMFSSCF